MISGTKSIPSGIPQGSTVGPILVSLFITVLANGTEDTFSKFAGDKKLGGEANTPGDTADFYGLKN